jgi:hypothetical protein
MEDDTPTNFFLKYQPELANGGKQLGKRSQLEGLVTISSSTQMTLKNGKITIRVKAKGRVFTLLNVNVFFQRRKQFPDMKISKVQTSLAINKVLLEHCPIVYSVG